MAGALSGVMYCPLTAIFLIAEITNGYGLIIPLMIVSSLAYFIARTFEPYYMETKQLAMDGLIFTHRREGNILSALSLENLTERDHKVLSPDDTFGDLVHWITKSNEQVFAIVDAMRRLNGVISLNDIRGQLFQPGPYDKMLLKEIMQQPPSGLPVNTAMDKVMREFDKTEASFLPVIDEERRFVGFISRTRLFEAYRSRVAQQKDIYEED